MIKIYFASNYGISANEWLKFYSRQTPGNNCIWGDLIGTNDISIADYFIVQDDTTDPVDINRTIFFGREPDHVVSRMASMKWQNSFRFLHHEFGTTWMPQTWWVDIKYDSINDEPYKKESKLSAVDSGNTFLPGHKRRVDFINKVINKYPDIDVWGKITNNRENIKPYKTSLPIRAKEAALLPYRYSLAIENGRTDYYFSEKLIDPIMCWTMPIYYGCKNISKFLPKGSYINVDIESPNAVDEVIDIINSDYREKNLDKLIEARKLIMDQYNIWPTVKLAIDYGRII